MKNILIAIMLSLFVATSCFADHIMTANMEVVKSSPVINGDRYADIDAVTNPLGGSTEVFCIERMPALKGVNRYDFYTIEHTTYYNKAGKYNSAKKIAQLKEASWYANWFLNVSGGTDNEKAIAQIAIWGALDAIGTYNGPFAADVMDLLYHYAIATDKNAYVTDWAIAVSPGDGSPIVWGEVGQNFLVNISKTPELSTILYVYPGLLLLTGVDRKKYLNKLTSV